MTHREWLDQLRGGTSIRRVAIRAEISQRTLASQYDRDRIHPENIVKIAIAFDQSPWRALVDCEVVPPEYAVEVDPVTALRLVSDDDLVAEFLRRLKSGQATPAFDTPVDQLPDWDNP